MGIACSILHKNSFQKGEFVNQVIVCKKIDMDLSKSKYIHLHYIYVNTVAIFVTTEILNYAV